MNINVLSKSCHIKKAVISAVSLFISGCLALSGTAVNVNAAVDGGDNDTADIDVVIDVSKDRKYISKYIYGVNDVYGLSGLTVSAVKQSGAEISSYNWETNASNSASDGGYVNSKTLVTGYSPLNEAALLTRKLTERAERYGIPSRYVTLQMMGFAANDADGTVTANDTEKRWASVLFEKNDDLLTEPDIYDDTVYMDEYVSFLANTYGSAAEGGINGYFLDSEPESWQDNYKVLSLEELTAKELVTRSAELAGTVKKIDPTALVYGPSVKNLESFVNLGNPDDWETYKNSYSWFIDYYLDSMRQASENAGIRLLDVLDLHFISEARSVVSEPVVGTDSVLANEERMQAVRVLWDSTYTENSDAAILYKAHTPIIPTIQASIRMFYPDTKLSFSEYNFGGGDNISGGIAEADVLGVFGEQGVYMACLKPDLSDFSYQKSGINIYTNYDGEGSSYGNISVYSDNGGDTMSSAYASVMDGNDGDLKAIIINKNYSADKTASVSIKSDLDYTSAEVYSFNSESAEITFTDFVDDIENNSFEYVIEPLSVYLFVFNSDSIIEEDENVSESGNDPSEKPVTSVTSQPEPEHVEVTAGTGRNEEADLPDENAKGDIVTSVVSSVSVVGTDEEGETITEIVTEIVTEEALPNASGGDNAETAAQADADSSKKEEKSREVPTAVKATAIVLCVLVGAAMVYILASDRNIDGKHS
jgi:hypothetical protein